MSNDWLNDYPVAPKAATPAAAGNDWLNQYPVAPRAAKVRPAPQPDPTYDPTEGMSTGEKLLVGFGQAVHSAGQGIGQYIGMSSPEDIAQSRKDDSAILNTGAGSIGSLAGNVALAVPTIAIPGAATLRGAALIGAAQGALQPSLSAGETAGNVVTGGLLGAGGVATGRALGAAYQGGKALVEPFTGAGREKIAGRVIQRFADNPNAVAAATGRRSITGAVPTLAEETRDAGMARLQDAVRSLDPQIAGRIDNRLVTNNAARYNALERLTGSNGGRDAAMAARATTTRPMYDAANSLGIDFDTLSAAQKGEMTKVMAMPAIKTALKEAKANAANFGMTQGTEGSMAGLHQAKMAMDDSLRDLTNQGLGTSNKAQAIRASKDRLVTFMDSMSGGAYGDARKKFAQMSTPINQMDTIQEILTKGTSATSDLSGTPRLMPNALTSVVKTPEAEAAIIKKATGGKAGVNKLAELLTPEQNKIVQAVINETDLTGAVARAGNGPGSATAQRMAAQNVLSRLVGPTGLPSSWAESAIANTVVGKPLNMLYGGVAEPRIQQALADAVLDPTKAKAAIRAAQNSGINLPQGSTRQLLNHIARVSPSSLMVSQPDGR
jgi:hypothetical protein